MDRSESDKPSLPDWFDRIEKSLVPEDGRESAQWDSFLLHARRFFETTDASAAKVPARIGPYRIDGFLGAGGYGFVHKAYDADLKRTIALKIPRPEHLMNEAGRKLFLREARAAARLSHPGIVQVHQVGEADGFPFIASEYCDGITLARWLQVRGKPVEASEAVEFLLRVCDAVEHAHSKAVIHRDLKPANILLVARTPSETPIEDRPLAELDPKITDFGLATVLADGFTTHSSPIAGTPAYMAPEQIKGNLSVVREPADTYALGAILYEMLTCRTPYPGDSVLEIFQKMALAQCEPPRAWNKEVPKALSLVCEKCLAREIELRYASAAELREALNDFRDGKPTGWNKEDRLRRVQAWLRRPERVRDAGWLLLYSSLSVALWVACCIIWFGFIQPIAPEATYFRSLLVVNHLVCAWLGWRLAHLKRGVFWWAFGLTFLNWAASFAGIFHTFPSMAAIYYEPFIRVLLFLLLHAIFAIQLGALAIAVPARRNA